MAHKHFDHLKHLIEYFSRDCFVFVHVDKRSLFNGGIDNAFYSNIIDYWGVYDRFRNKVNLYQDEVY
jgi:hypothetical protein